ncbi:uncharacterized protein MICPUCDRAFT_3013, partial [Micromonas pusilla CCMP1545]
LVRGGAFAENAVAAWLAGGCVWVFSLVVLGGATRLTRSGLSMTDWKFEWERAPSTDVEWRAEFDKYKRSPEYVKTNVGMTLEEYKFIYWMEFGHRMWGRGLGAYFALPLAVFAAAGFVTPGLMARLAGLFTLGACQGMIGWWMVKSGLTLRRAAERNEIPRVSPYRLATHLTGAFTIYVGMLWTTLSVAFPGCAIEDHARRSMTWVAGDSGARRIAMLALEAARKARQTIVPLAGLIATTALSGAYVAGMDAGRAFNTFPLMGGRVVPEEYFDMWEKYGWRNFFENTAAVQFDHRALAVTTLLAVTYAWGTLRGNPRLPAVSSLALDAVMVVTLAQVGLGISTLLYHVPVSLGSLHQANALLLMTTVVGLLYTLRVP